MTLSQVLPVGCVVPDALAAKGVGRSVLRGVADRPSQHSAGGEGATLNL